MANATFRYSAYRGRLLKPTIREESLRTYLRFALIGPLIWIVTIFTAVFLGGTVTLVLTTVGLVIYLFVEPPALIDEDPDEVMP